MAHFRTLLVVGFLVIVLANGGIGTIHRAKNAKKTFSARNHNPDPTEAVQLVGGHSRETWVYATISAMLVGLSGIFPLLVIPIEAGKALRKGGKWTQYRLLNAVNQICGCLALGWAKTSTISESVIQAHLKAKEQQQFLKPRKPLSVRLISDNHPRFLL